ncbi:ribosomal RNA processing protein 1 homolog B [Hyperolius riggenbachi]|uniref:ribosomal RNA processing protein 1 homolog B n=1 Tax=Hyperolius riggenbachi TaxID=752182 RepID=UPI0035A2B31E
MSPETGSRARAAVTSSPGARAAQREDSMADPCVQLAQRLAANERRPRERALRRLRAYLQQRSAQPGGGFGADEFSKIWKGLFYCMWMQDKPLLQEELALNMAKLVHSLQSRESRNLFIREQSGFTEDGPGTSARWCGKEYCSNPLLQQSVVNGIFQMILDQAPFAIEELMKELGETPAGEEMADDGGSRGPQVLDTEDIGPVLQFDYLGISERLFALASRQNIPARNRKSLYRLVKRFKDLAEGVFPHDDFPEEVSTDEDDDEFSSWRFRQRQKKFQEKLLASQGIAVEPEKKGKRRRAAPETTDSSKVSGTTEVPPAKKKRKKASVKVEHPVLNGRAESPPTEKIENSRGMCKTPPNPDLSHDGDAPLTKIHMKRRKRSCLLRMGLSVLPLRGTSLLRRRRLIAQRRQVASIKPAQVTPAAALPQTPSLKTRKTTAQDFVTFQKSEAPKPLYVKSSKTRGRQINKKLNGQSKKVTFSLNKNMTTEFKRTDRSLLVSPAGSSRIPFNPEQQPAHGVLKSPTSSPRPRASDFF